MSSTTVPMTLLVYMVQELNLFVQKWAKEDVPQRLDNILAYNVPI